MRAEKVEIHTSRMHIVPAWFIDILDTLSLVMLCTNLDVTAAESEFASTRSALRHLTDISVDDPHSVSFTPLYLARI